MDGRYRRNHWCRKFFLLKASIFAFNASRWIPVWVYSLRSFHSLPLSPVNWHWFNRRQASKDWNEFCLAHPLLGDLRDASHYPLDQSSLWSPNLILKSHAPFLRHRRGGNLFLLSDNRENSQSCLGSDFFSSNFLIIQANFLNQLC